jgi:hypothetical protein
VRSKRLRFQIPLCEYFEAEWLFEWEVLKGVGSQKGKILACVKKEFELLEV